MAHWFNPLAWMALRRLQNERERACDDLVLSAGTRPAAYAEELLNIARTMHTRVMASTAAIPMARTSQLEGRLRAILDAGCNRRAVTRWAMGAGLGVLTLVVLAFASIQPTQSKARQVPADSGLEFRRFAKGEGANALTAPEIARYRQTLANDGPNAGDEPGEACRWIECAIVPPADAVTDRWADKRFVLLVNQPAGVMSSQTGDWTITRIRETRSKRITGGATLTLDTQGSARLGSMLRIRAGDWLATILDGQMVGLTSTQASWQGPDLTITDGKNGWDNPARFKILMRLAELFPGASASLTIKQGWNGEVVDVPFPVTIPQTIKDSAAWKLWLKRRHRQTFEGKDAGGRRYEIGAIGNYQVKEGKGISNVYSHAATVARYRPDGTLEAATVFAGPTGATEAPAPFTMQWQWGVEWGVERVTFYGTDGKTIIGALRGRTRDRDLPYVESYTMRGQDGRFHQLQCNPYGICYMDSEAELDTQGIFQIKKLLAGNYSLVNASFVENEVPVMTERVESVKTERIDSAETKDMISGMVVDERGKPIEGVRVDIWTWYPGNETKTDKAGRFHLTKFNEENGRVEIRFTKEGYSPLLIPQQATGALSEPVVMGSRTWFEGELTGLDGKPVPDALIRANQGPVQGPGVKIGTVWTETRSDKNGKYKMLVQEGQYDIEVRASGGGVGRLQGIPIKKNVAKQQDIPVLPGITFQARIIDSLTSRPVAGVRFSNIARPEIKGLSDAKGDLRIEGLTPGKMEFAVAAKGYARWWSETCVSQWNRWSKDSSRGGWQRNFDDLDFELKAGMPPVTIVVERGVKITGRILDPAGKPVGGATAAPARTGSGNSLTGDTRFSVKSKADGTFEMLLPASHDCPYNLVAHDGGYGQWRGWANGVAQPIRTKPGEEIKDVELRLTRPGVVRGKVVDGAGNPVAGREVRASAFDRLENRYYDPTTKTGRDGAFELKFVRPGKQYIQAAPFWLDAKEAPAGTSIIVDVPAGGVVNDLRLEAGRDGQ